MTPTPCPVCGATAAPERVNFLRVKIGCEEYTAVDWRTTKRKQVRVGGRKGKSTLSKTYPILLVKAVSA